jgi:hypothetical protein
MFHPGGESTDVYGSARDDVTAFLVVSGFLITAHPPPFGPTGLAVFVAAILLLVRSQATAPAPAPHTARLA